MNEWQIVQQVQYKLRAATWPDGSSKVFASESVVASQALTQEAATRIRFPAAFVGVSSGDPDPEMRQTPELVRFGVTVTLVVAVQDDELGEAPMLGSNRGGTNSSSGRGLLEIQERVKDAVRLLTDVDGLQFIWMGASMSQPRRSQDLGYVVARDLSWEAWGTDCYFYHAPSSFSATDQGGGNVDLAWTLPPDRFDRTSVVLRRASGSTAPASATDGTGVTLSGDLATSVTDSPGAGTYSYSLFGGYTRFGSSVTDYSDPVSLTVVVT